jgi:orotate phosphoribosyltransferase
MFGQLAFSPQPSALRMQPYQRLPRTCIAAQCPASEFTLKSGRIKLHFFNAGLFDSGSALPGSDRPHAQAAASSGIAFDMLFGPAYKGIALAAAPRRAG